MDHTFSSCCIFLIFIAFSSSSVHAEIRRRSSITPINRDLYHSSADLLAEIQSLVHHHPNKLSIETIKSGNQGYQAEIDVVTYCRDRREDDKSKFRILLTFAQHAREIITSELALRIISILSEEEFLPKMDRKSLNRTLGKLIIKVVPMENVNGRKLVESGQLCERKNGRGVDLNRNWSVDWGKKEKDYDPYEENPGTAPFSEPESQIMRKLVLSFKPHLWVNVHSGTQALFMPYDHRNTTPDGGAAAKMKALINDLNHQHFQGHCMTGSGGRSVGYLAHGTATDYVYEIANVPMAFTFEIYGDKSAPANDCFKMFNPTDLTTFKKVLNDWSAAFFTLFKLGPQLLGMANFEESVKSISINDYINGYMMSTHNQYEKNMDVFELGLQERRSYFKIFMISCVVLIFMFCTRISMSKPRRPIASACLWINMWGFW